MEISVPTSAFLLVNWINTDGFTVEDGSGAARLGVILR